MKTNPSAALRTFWLGLVLLFCGSFQLRAEEFGLFTYSVNHDGTSVTITGYPISAVGPVEIPAEIAGKAVTRISDSVFTYHTGLTSVTIPSSVTSIGAGAFAGCAGLTSVTLQHGLTTLGDYVFSGCTGLTSVSIPSSVTSIGQTAFYGCTGLTSVTISSSVTTLGDYMFYGCTGLTSVDIPSSVTSIGEYAFWGCIGLASVTIPSSVASIDFQAFSSCTGLTSVTIPPGVTSIGDRAFYRCAGLTSVTLPSSVTSIGNEAFYRCTGLTSVTLQQGLTFISHGLFSGCSGLTSVIIPSSVTSIGVEAFSSCTGLTNVSIPSSVTSIDVEAFSGCTGLASVSIPSSVTSIGEWAFHHCTGLRNIEVGATNPNYSSLDGVLFNKGRTGLIKYPEGRPGSYTIPASVTSIAGGAFSGCSGLTSAVFLGCAPSIDSWLFENAAPGFTIYYLSSRPGFTSPTWRGYPATRINETTYPAAAWLLKHGLWYNTTLQTDPDGDGVTLRMAWALDLDPTRPQLSQLPSPVLTGNTLSITFSATRPGLIYRAESSTDLTHWSATGVNQTVPDPDGRSTASVPLDARRRFLRLAVE